MRKLIWCFSVWSIACLSILLKAESVQNNVGGSPTGYSFQVTARLTDPKGHFDVISWRVTKLTDQKSGPLSQSERQGSGVTRRPGVLLSVGKAKDRTSFSRIYPIDLFLKEVR